MVAASKMRNAQVAVDNSRGIVDPFYRLFGDYPGEQGEPTTSSCTAPWHPAALSCPLCIACAAVEVNKDLTLAITSDKGLCGGLNSNITKYTRTILKLTADGEGRAAMRRALG